MDVARHMFCSTEWCNLVDWSEANELPINTDKCCVMDIITKKKLTLKPVECGDGSSLTQVSNMLLLGVTISSTMKWDLHIDNALNKAQKRFFILVNLRKSGCPPSLIFRAYCTLLRCVLLRVYASPTAHRKALQIREKTLPGDWLQRFPYTHASWPRLCLETF